MDEKALEALALEQLQSLVKVAEKSLGADHSLTTALSEAIELVDSAEEAPLDNDFENDEYGEELPTPDGFANREEYADFLADQLGEEALDTAIVDVVGTIHNEDGTTQEVGNAAESFRQARETVEAINEERAEYGEEIPANARLFSVEYTLLSGDELTEGTVRQIVDHPVSNNLKALGNLAILDILGQGSQRTVNFAILEEGELPLAAFQEQIVAYRGTTAIPGVGLVQAAGNVTTD